MVTRGRRVLTRPRTVRIEKEDFVMAETWSGEFYCVKCKAKREASGEVRVNDKGTRMAKATCPVCGTNLNRILGKA
jgi:transcription elongation factor Elf1